MESNEQWHLLLADAITNIGTRDFFQALNRALRSRIVFERPQAWLYHRHLPPQLMFHNIEPEHLALELDPYLEGPYREDPFYELSMSKPQAGLYRLSDLIEGKLEDSSYYVNYYNRISIVDELMILIPLTDGQTLNICLMRGISTGPFSDDDIQWLEGAAKVAIALVVQHVGREEFQSTHAIRNDFDIHINQTLASFGSSVVTEREQQVLRLTLQGYSTAVAAERLDISIETLRRHRKNIYQKLDLSSQADLFTLFLNVLRSSSLEGNKDPLAAYLAPPTN